MRFPLARTKSPTSVLYAAGNGRRFRFSMTQGIKSVAPWWEVDTIESAPLGVPLRGSEVAMNGSGLRLTAWVSVTVALVAAPRFAARPPDGATGSSAVRVWSGAEAFAGAPLLI